MECIHLITKRICCEAALSPLKQLLYPPPPHTHTQKIHTHTSKCQSKVKKYQTSGSLSTIS